VLFQTEFVPTKSDFDLLNKMLGSA